jgi:hypothetical protein
VPYCHLTRVHKSSSSESVSVSESEVGLFALAARDGKKGQLGSRSSEAFVFNQGDGQSNQTSTRSGSSVAMPHGP